MPLVRPFRGLGYSLARYATTMIPARVHTSDDQPAHPGRVADLTDLVCPPFDVISEQQRNALLERDPRNAVRLELNPSPDPHRAAAEQLEAWKRDGTLERRPDASVYYYAHATPAQPDAPTVQGVLARVRLEPWGMGIRPHEHTMPGPKQDRLRLLRETRTQMSPILAIYFDRSERHRHLMSRGWTDEWRARDADGLLHQLSAVEPDDRMLGHLSRQRLFVADGHHRYETALAYQAELRARPQHAGAAPGELAADWIMAVLVNAEVEEMEVLPTHRLLRGVDPSALNAFLEHPGPLFATTSVPPATLSDALAAATGDDGPVFGLLLARGAYLLHGEREAVAVRMRREPLSTAVRRLDPAVLQAAILEERLGIDGAAAGAAGQLSYTTSPAAALEAVSRGEADAAVLLRPTRIDQLAAVANAGDMMPHKSTYFHPKLLTGMVFNPLSEGED